MNHSVKNNSPFRFGILVDGNGLLNWELRCVQNLIESQVGNLVLIIQLEPDTPKKTSARPRHSLSKALCRLYQRLFFRLSSLQRVRSEVLVHMFSTSEYYAENNSDQSADDPTNGEKIRKLELDFILGFAEPTILSRYNNSSRCGVWWFSLGDSFSNSREVPFIDYIVKREFTVHASLWRNGTVHKTSTELWHGCHKISPSSYGADLECVLNDLAKWPLWACQRLCNGLESKDFGTFPLAGNSTSNRIGLGRMLIWPASMFFSRIMRKLLNVFVRPQWNVAVLKRPIHTLLNNGQVDDAEFLDIGSDKDVFWADPFGVMKDGILTILFELFDYQKNKGDIASIQILENGFQTEIKSVFEKSYHLSYPFIFKDGESFYCVPESGRAKKTEIHRAVQFPETWERIAIVDEGLSAIDSTVFRHNGRWWLACTIIEHEINTNLFLYHADKLTGPWIFHKSNPVKTDVRSSRPAGTPFVHQGELYRPSQDCSLSYGGSVCINRVVRLSPDEFFEEPVCRIKPAPYSCYPNGLHTISAAGDLTLIDGLRHRFIAKGIVISLKKRYKRFGSSATK